MTEQKTITVEEHFVLVDYYQSKIRELEAKLEVTNNNLMDL